MKANYTAISGEIVTGPPGPLLLSLLSRRRRDIDRRAMAQHLPLYLARTTYCAGHFEGKTLESGPGRQKVRQL